MHGCLKSAKFLNTKQQDEKYYELKPKKNIFSFRNSAT